MKKQSVRRLEQLKKRFPAIASMEASFYGTPEEADTLRIVVQRADPSLMYRFCDNVDGVRSFCNREDGCRGKRTESIYAIGKDGLLLARSKEIDESAGFGRVCTRDLIDHCGGVNIPGDTIEYVLWTTEYIWYQPATDDQEKHGIYLGKKIETERFYLVYLPPKDGTMVRLLAETSLRHNVELSERLLTIGLLEHDGEFEDVSKALANLAQRFEREVYLTGLKELVEKSSKRGMGGVFNGVKLMSWVMCARIMVTLEVPNSKNPEIKDTLTFIGNEPPAEARFGWRSIYATMDRAREMVDRVIAGWTATANKASTFTDDAKVKLDVLA